MWIFSWPGCQCGHFPGLAVNVDSFQVWLLIWTVSWPGCQCGQFPGLTVSVAEVFYLCSLADVATDPQATEGGESTEPGVSGSLDSPNP